MPSMRARWSAVCLVVLSLVVPALVLGQGTTGRILGRVADPSGAVLGNVKVTSTNDATGVSRDTTSSENGDYVFPDLPVGTYSLTFDLSGFKKSVRHNISLDVNQVITLNMTMQLGAAQETVDVTSEAPLGGHHQHATGGGNGRTAGLEPATEFARHLSVAAIAARV